MNESNEITRVWHKGPPPHIGWWNASFVQDPEVWRWWDGAQWTGICYEDLSPEMAGLAATTRCIDSGVEWCDYWPENARVERAI
jgi:hypothetical protein